LGAYQEESNVIPEPIKIDELPWDLKVNGISVQSVQIRSVPASDDFQILMTDPQLGRFSLTRAFELEMREEGSSWLTVTLEQLTKALTESSEFLQTEDIPKASEMAERRLFDRFDDVDIPHRNSPRVAKITGHDRCVKRVQFLLYEAAIPHQVSGTVFLVPDVAQARTTLVRAGFENSTITAGALVEPQSECAIHLLERPCSCARSRRRNPKDENESPKQTRD
jgi:hypothetical protein